MLELDKIYEMDCMGGMEELDDNSIDAIITDPPYGISKEKDDYVATDFIQDAYRILKDDRMCFCFVGQKTLADYFVAFRNAGFNWMNTIVWHYRNTLSRETKRFVIQYDPILLMSKGEGKINVDDVRIPYLSKERLKYPVSNQKKQNWRPNPLGAKRGDVWECPAITSPSYSKEKVGHKWQKPIRIVDIMVKASSNKGDIILDPFIGSGTTAVSCKRLGRRYIGFEIDSNYVRIANDRLKQGCIDHYDGE